MSQLQHIFLTMALNYYYFFINLINETYYKYDERRRITSKVFNIPMRTGQEFSLGLEVILKDKVNKKMILKC